jgi:hypothetical protein
MKKILSLVIALLLLTGCFEKERENPLSALSLEHNSIQMKTGDSWLYKRMFINYDWIGADGLLKRFWDCGENTIDDSRGMPLDTFQTYDILEKIGTADIDPDTIIPWGRRKD